MPLEGIWPLSIFCDSYAYATPPGRYIDLADIEQQAAGIQGAIGDSSAPTAMGASQAAVGRVVGDRISLLFEAQIERPRDGGDTPGGPPETMLVSDEPAFEETVSLHDAAASLAVAQRPILDVKTDEGGFNNDGPKSLPAPTGMAYYRAGDTGADTRRNNRTTIATNSVEKAHRGQRIRCGSRRRRAPVNSAIC